MELNKKFQLIRNATVLLTFAGKKLLIDPMLAGKDAYPGIPGTLNSQIKFPTVGLPLPLTEIVSSIDAVIITHTHSDHWDEAAAKAIGKDTVIFVQNEKDAARIKSNGFTNVTVLQHKTRFQDISILKTPGQHGSNALYADSDLAEALGETYGIILNAQSEKTIYFVGDTIWTDKIRTILENIKPDIVVLNAGDAQMEHFGSIIMGKDDTLKVHQILPEATIVPIHMEAVGHAILSRQELWNFSHNNNFSHQLTLLKDGECEIF